MLVYCIANIQIVTMDKLNTRTLWYLSNSWQHKLLNCCWWFTYSYKN